MNILIVEDDPHIRDLLGKELEKWDFKVTKVEDFNQTIEIFQREQPHLVLMDIQLPVYDGYYFTKEIRKRSEIPIIFISSKTDHMTQIMAIEMGADDFITKPFDLSFAVSKIKALLRRTYTYALDDWEVGQLKYDEHKLELTYNEQTIPLTKIENMLIHALLTHKNDFVSRNALMDMCWQGDDFIDDNTLFVNISRLRKKLAGIGLENVIETKKNIGYRFNENNIWSTP